ncbi:tetratricopeptide repeat protein [Corallococcus sp. 4LFB]|uniref:tetratricopeptide repeat protein n=1 Tax=Corallococcus sp. 4LFB TaxID=3383249 RepID=UPI003974FCC2
MASRYAQEGGQLLQQGQPAEAVKSFQKGLSIDPKDVDCLMGLVRTHLSTGAAKDAEGAVTRLLQVQPDNTEAQAHLAMLKAQAGDAVALVTLKALAAAPTAGYFERFNLGTLLAERGDLEGAKAAFEAAQVVAPHSAYPHFELGRIAMQRKDTAAAAAHFQQAAALAPTEALPHLLLSRAHAANGAIGQAIAAATRALEHAQGRTRVAVLQDLLRLYLQANSQDAARRTILELRELEPTQVRYIHLHGLACMLAGELAEAKALFGEALQRAPNQWDILHSLAQAHEALGERAEARKQLEAAVAAAPQEPGPTNDLVRLLMGDQDHARARVLLERVLEANPQDALTHLNLARATQPFDRAEATRHARQAQSLGADVAVKDEAARLLSELGG